MRGSACTAAELENDHTVGATSDRALCRACEQETAGALADAPQLYVQLRNLTLDRFGAGPMGDRVTRSRSGSFGLNASPLHLTEALHWQMTGWADEVITTAERPAVDRASQPEGSQVDDACLLLSRYLSVWISLGETDFQVTRGNADPDDPKAEPTTDTVTMSMAGWQGCDWLINWRTSAERLLKLPLLVHYPPEPCPACDTRNALRRKDGEDKVWCSVCRKAWTLEMYETFVHAWLGAA
jgi:hypothetical protein